MLPLPHHEPGDLRTPTNHQWRSSTERSREIGVKTGRGDQAGDIFPTLELRPRGSGRASTPAWEAMSHICITHACMT